MVLRRMGALVASRKLNPKANFRSKSGSCGRAGRNAPTRILGSGPSASFPIRLPQLALEYLIEGVSGKGRSKLDSIDSLGLAQLPVAPLP